MTKHSTIVFAAILLLSLAACSASDEFNSGAVIPSAQAADVGRSLYPPLAADAEEDRTYEYQ